MGSKSYTVKRGRSLANRSSKPVSESWADHVVARKKTYRLDDMLAQITPENRPPEQYIGPSRGAEEW